jgi:hypothetical protein
MESQYTILEANIAWGYISIEKELEELGLPWYVTICKNTAFINTKINGIIMQGKIEKPMYFYKYRLGNKSFLAKFVPLEIMKDSKSMDVRILKQEPGIIELALSKLLYKKYIIMHSSKIDPELIIERFSKPAIYRYDNSRDSR